MRIACPSLATVKETAVDAFKTGVVSVGMMTDAYEVFVMNIVYLILVDLYGSTPYSSSLNVTILVGIALGQLLFGVLGDRLGRKPMFLVTGALLIVFAASAAVVPVVLAQPFVALAVVRFFLGIGIGGEYPLSSAITLESAPAAARGRRMVLIFAMRGVGNALAPLAVLALLLLPVPLGAVWRVALGLGALPLLLTIGFRWLLTYPGAVRRRHEHVRLLRVLRHHWRALLGTAGSWFLFDIAFYGNNMCNAFVLDAMGFAGDPAPGDAAAQRAALATNAAGNAVLTLIAFPGFVVAYLLITRCPKRTMQMAGFLGTALCYVVIAFAGDALVAHCKWAYVALYGLSFFFQNMGPNTMTYILAAEVYPAQVRTTLSGLSAAAGKVGAMVGTAVFDPFTRACGVTATFCVCAGLMLLGMLVTLCVPPAAAADEEDAPDAAPLKAKLSEAPTPSLPEPAEGVSPASPADTLRDARAAHPDAVFIPLMRTRARDEEADTAVN